jgi:hypothetical protein
MKKIKKIEAIHKEFTLGVDGVHEIIEMPNGNVAVYSSDINILKTIKPSYKVRVSKDENNMLEIVFTKSQVTDIYYKCHEFGKWEYIEYNDEGEIIN